MKLRSSLCARRMPKICTRADETVASSWDAEKCSRRVWLCTFEGFQLLIRLNFFVLTCLPLPRHNPSLFCPPKGTDCYA
jgi:hypothetical protein